MTKRIPLQPNLVIAGKIQRLLSPLPRDTQKTVLDFLLKCLEESAEQPAV